VAAAAAEVMALPEMAQSQDKEDNLEAAEAQAAMPDA
jgi:hypothetical protein